MQTQDKQRIIPVLLSGGSGTRLWPLSRTAYPKQFHTLVGSDTMLVDTMRRMSGTALFADPIIIGSHQHRFLIAEQLREAGYENARIVLEPRARNTAPAAAVAALMALESGENPLILLAPADHVILDRVAFLEAVQTAARAAVSDGGYLVLFGIRPDSPATGYGYIRKGADLADVPGVYAVNAFVEKPDAATAQHLLADGQHSWNSGIFLMPARVLVDEMERLAPTVLAAARRALAEAVRDPDFVRLDEEAFAAAPSISLDYAVMEKTARTAVVPSSFGWTDVGSWKTLWEISSKNPSGTVISGDVIDAGSVNCYLRSEGPAIGVAGIRDLIVVATPDAVLVIQRDADQDVKKIVEWLNAAGRTALTNSFPTGIWK